MTPGPGGHPGGGGHHGGHHGGHRGGYHGGYHGGPRGYGGPPRWHGGPPPHSSSKSGYYSGGESITSRVVGALTEAEFSAKHRRQKFGVIKGTLMGLRLSTTGAMREESFKAKISSVDFLIKEKRITANEAKKRKMEAAETYFGYLRKIGFYTQAEYDEEMREFAQEIGATYTPTSGGRTR